MSKSKVDQIIKFIGGGIGITEDGNVLTNVKYRDWFVMVDPKGQQAIAPKPPALFHPIFPKHQPVDRGLLTEQKIHVYVIPLDYRYEWGPKLGYPYFNSTAFAGFGYKCTGTEWCNTQWSRLVSQIGILETKDIVVHNPMVYSDFSQNPDGENAWTSHLGYIVRHPGQTSDPAPGITTYDLMLWWTGWVGQHISYVGYLSMLSVIVSFSGNTLIVSFLCTSDTTEYEMFRYEFDVSLIGGSGEVTGHVATGAWGWCPIETSEDWLEFPGEFEYRNDGDWYSGSYSPSGYVRIRLILNESIRLLHEEYW
jgi:hypothetical protein